MKITVWLSEVKLKDLLSDAQKQKIYKVSDKQERSVYLQVITATANIYMDTIDDATVATGLMINDDQRLLFPIEWIDKISLISDTAWTDVRVLIS